MRGLIFLIGFRGTGKTTVGELLAGKLGYDFVDMDQCICRKKGATVKTIVNREGWEGFRHCEAEVLAELGGATRTVVATGGGAVLHRQIWQGLEKNSSIIWLIADRDIMLQRINRDDSTADNRPSLSGKGVSEELMEIFREREPLYREIAHFTIDTGLMKVTEVVDCIYDKVTKIPD